MQDIDPAAVGARLRAARKLRGLTGRQVADAVGVGESMVSQYESGAKLPGRDTLLRLSEALNAPLEHLLHGAPLLGDPDGALLRAAAGRTAVILGEIIRAHREARGRTQAEVADEVGVSRNTEGAWERGTAAPTMDDLASLAEALGVPVTELIGTESLVGRAMLLRDDRWQDSLRQFCESSRPFELGATEWELAVFGAVALGVREPQTVEGWASLLMRVQLELRDKRFPNAFRGNEEGEDALG